MASIKSSALPCGTPSTTSTKTISASSLAAIQCAVVAPTLPAPTIDTFFRIVLPYKLVIALGANRIHVFDHARGEFAGADLGCTLHLPLEVIGDELLLDGPLQRRFDQPCCLAPSDKIEQHHACT